MLQNKAGKLISIKPKPKTYFIFSLVIAILLSVFMVYFVEYKNFATEITDKTIGFNAAWQLNSFTESSVNTDKYNTAVVEAYSNLADFIGIEDEFVKNNHKKIGGATGGHNLKNWFQAFVNKVSNLDINENIVDTLIVNIIKKSEAHWAIKTDVNYTNNEVAYSAAQKLRRDDTIPKSIFLVYNRFVKYLQESLNPKAANVIPSDNSKEFQRYNDMVYKAILGAHFNKYDLLRNNIKFHRFYITTRTIRDGHESELKDTSSGNVVIYPGYGGGEQFHSFEPSRRPWWRAAFDHTFPYGFEKSGSLVSYGLTGIYGDIQDDHKSVLLNRTFFCKFKVPTIKENVEFLACVDLFFTDSLISANPFKIPVYESFVQAPFTSAVFKWNYGYEFILDAIVLSLLVFAALNFNKEWLPIRSMILSALQRLSFSDHEIQTISFKLVRKERFTLNRNVLKHREIVFENVNKQINEFEVYSDQAVKAALSFFKGAISFNGTYGKRSRQAISDASSTTYKFENILGIDKTDYYRCIEFWNIYDQKKKVILGTFIVKWLNPIFTKGGDLGIDTVGPIANLDRIENSKLFLNLKREFESLLLGKEEDEFTIEIRTTSEEFDIEMPPLLEKRSINDVDIKSYFLGQGRIKPLLERKFFLKVREDNTYEFKMFLKLYEETDINAVCGISFLKNLCEGKRFGKFLQETGNRERIFIEEDENEFFVFYKALTDEDKAIFNIDNSNFRIWKYEEESVIQKIYKNYDFALAKDINNETQYVLYSYDNSASQVLGWVSWRSVDIVFYNTIYESIQEVSGGGMKISEYLQQCKEKEGEGERNIADLSLQQK